LKNTEIEIITSIKEVLNKSQLRITIIPHENPDGDAMGSSIGLAEILINAGHEVTIITSNDYPAFLKWFSTKAKIVIYDSDKKLGKQILNDTELLFCLDYNEPGRAGRLEKKVRNFDRTKILIDHHPYPNYFCDFTISEPQYSSTAELLFDVTTLLGLEQCINSSAAEALYTGILTDTGSFNHNTSDPNTFKVVSKLMEFGVDTEKIHGQVYNNFSASRMKLLGYCLNDKMKVFPEYRAAFISLSKKELEEFNFKPGDTEGFVNYPLSINNIVFSAIFIEKENYVKASFRSKGNFATNSFSNEHFNGGGHLNASGGESKLSFEKTIEKFTQLLPEYKHQLLETKI